MSLRHAPLTIALLLVNGLVFVVDYYVLGGGAVGPLMAAGAIIPSQVQAGEYYRILTAGFLHFGVAHIALNGYALAQAGMVVENFYGTARFAAIYAVALVAGGLLAYATTIGSDVATAGASGAIMGLFGAMAALGLKNARLRGPLLRWAMFPIVATLAYGFMNSHNISNAGHIGGLIGGALSGFVLPTRPLVYAGAPDDAEEEPGDF